MLRWSACISENNDNIFKNIFLDRLIERTQSIHIHALNAHAHNPNTHIIQTRKQSSKMIPGPSREWSMDKILKVFGTDEYNNTPKINSAILEVVSGKSLNVTGDASIYGQMMQPIIATRDIILSPQAQIINTASNDSASSDNVRTIITTDAIASKIFNISGPVDSDGVIQSCVYCIDYTVLGALNNGEGTVHSGRIHAKCMDNAMTIRDITNIYSYAEGTVLPLANVRARASGGSLFIDCEGVEGHAIKWVCKTSNLSVGF